MENDPAPLAEIPPSPAQALKRLAERLEAGDPPPLDEISAALHAFKAAGLDKRAQETVIEAREDAKNGRLPDPLALRMIAKAIESAPAKRPPGRPKGSTTKKAESDGPVRIGSSLVGELVDDPRAGLKPGEPFPEEFFDDVDKGIDKLREQSERAVAALTDREREVLHERFGNGNGAAPPIAMFDVVGSLKDAIPDRPLGGQWSGFDTSDVDDDEIVQRTPAEWVALAADTIEHLDMPAHAELCGELYALAQRLEENPLADPDAGSLLERTEREIERRVERALRSQGDLPAWVIEWAREERARRESE